MKLFFTTNAVFFYLNWSIIKSMNYNKFRHFILRSFILYFNFFEFLLFVFNLIFCYQHVVSCGYKISLFNCEICCSNFKHWILFILIVCNNVQNILFFLVFVFFHFFISFAFLIIKKIFTWNIKLFFFIHHYKLS